MDKEGLKARFREKLGHRDGQFLNDWNPTLPEPERDDSCCDFEDSDSDSDSDSLVSEFGSDVGQFSNRLEQVEAMAAIHEDEHSEESDKSEESEESDESEGTQDEQQQQHKQQQQNKQQQQDYYYDQSSNLLDQDIHMHMDMHMDMDMHNSLWVSQCLQDLQTLSEQGGHTNIAVAIQTTHKQRMYVLHQLIQHGGNVNSTLTQPGPCSDLPDIHHTHRTNTADVTHRLDRELSLCRAEMSRLYNAARKEVCTLLWMLCPSIFIHILHASIGLYSTV